MVIETTLTFFAPRYTWKYPWFLSIFATAIFVTVDTIFFAATTLKLSQGGWFPLVIGVVIFTILVTWHRGRQILLEHLRFAHTPLQPFLESLSAHPPMRVAGTSVFLTADPNGVPHALFT